MDHDVEPGVSPRRTCTGVQLTDPKHLAVGSCIGVSAVAAWVEYDRVSVLDAVDEIDGRGSCVASRVDKSPDASIPFFSFISSSSSSIFFYLVMNSFFL